MERADRARVRPPGCLAAGREGSTGVSPLKAQGQDGQATRGRAAGARGLGTRGWGLEGQVLGARFWVQGAGDWVRGLRILDL